MINLCKVHRALLTLHYRELHTSDVLFRRNRALAGFKKGGAAPPERDVVDGKMMAFGEKLRYSYNGKEKYEYDKKSAVRPHCGQIEGKQGVEWNPRMGYIVKVADSHRVLEQDTRQLAEYLEEFKSAPPLQGPPQRQIPSSFVTPLMLELMDQISWTRNGGREAAFSTLQEAFELVKLAQLKEAKIKGHDKVELDCNKILTAAVKNLTPVVVIKFKQRILTKDGFVPCPVPVSASEATRLALRSLKKSSLPFKRKCAVRSGMLAENILDAYYMRGRLMQEIKENMELAVKYRAMYNQFGPYKNKISSNKSHAPQPHLWYWKKSLPLPNEAYGKAPGVPEWNVDDLVDEEDKT